MKSEADAKNEVMEQESKLQIAMQGFSADSDNLVVIQSPYLYLQAAGSRGIDSSKGVHLRWFLDGYLGENHIPKGDYAANNRFFNKRADFVRIYKIPYGTRDKITRNFDIYRMVPRFLHHDERLWIYLRDGSTFYLRFPDAARYQEALNSVNPHNDPSLFIKVYESVLELELKDYLSFAVNFIAETNAQFRAETFSVQNRSFAEDPLKISARKKFHAIESLGLRIVAENIKSVRFSIDSGILREINFETYQDFLDASIKEEQLRFIDKFALTTETELAFTRLEDATRFMIHKLWLKFNDDAFVNVKNYQDRWLMPGGLQYGVKTYIVSSDSDPTATVIYNDELDSENTTSMEVSLQNFLNLASTDFHIARMLGLGYIDISEPINTSEPDDSERLAGLQFIYLAVYRTEKDPENFEIEKNTEHLYLSLPTSIFDQRLPLDLKLNPIVYGLDVENGTETPFQITDSQGYTLYEPLRYIKLKASLKEDYQESLSFFKPPVEFQSSTFSSPLFVGFENKKEGDTDWLKPEISHDGNYEDPNGDFETKPVFFNKSDKPDYLHEVTTEGIDVYASYAVNIFSRASVLSNIQKTDKTIFRKANTLKAPTNVTTQIIQAENPLLLTSQAEQEWLENIDSTKTEILCRLSFDYYHIHDVNYRYGNKIRIFHKKQLPVKVIGLLAVSDNNDTNNPLCTLTTGDFSYLSDGQVFVPKINPAIKHKFIGGNITYRGKNYIVEEIILTNADGTYPKIKIRKNETREGVNTGGTYQLRQIFQAPDIDSTEGFLLVENLSKAANWTETTNNRFPFEIALGLPSWIERTESYQDAEGNQRQETVKGIWDKAEITPLTAQDGLYEIEFNATQLDNHPQFISPDNVLNKSSVDWYRGFIRIHTHGDAVEAFQRKVLNVEQILEINTGNNLKLIAFDPNFSNVNPNANIKTGTDISVNFHPGYRVYLRKDDSINFNKAALLPSDNEGTRSSIIGLQTLDTLSLDSTGEAYSSPMSVPALLLAREIKPPKKPRLPIGPSFATPPDFFNKATYSFTTEFEHKPWGLVFCRIDSNKILSCLYKKETIEQILQDLPPAGEDGFLGNRWLNLLSFDYSSNAGDFDSFPIDNQGNTYKLPKPDRTDVFTVPYNKPADVVDKIKDVIFSNLLPLTEQPLIFEYLKGGSYVPQPKKQKITDSNGRLLHPTHPDFDQAPMAKKISNTKVLFTDFTLDGNMSSEILYFYIVREMSNSMQFGEPSPFMGPVRLVNTKSPEKLNLRKMNVQFASVNNNFESAVIFEINKFPKSQEISKIQILRTLNSADGLSARNMRLVKEIEVQNLDLSGETIFIKDDFQNDAEIPYGVPLYYKLVGVRQINYIDVDNSPKNIAVFSEPTKTLLTNVVDLQRPESPTVAAQSQIVVDGIIQQIVFSWNKNCYNGSYRLYFMNNNNVWVKIYEIQTNDESKLNFEYNCNLETENSSGETLYYKFKVDVENTSGIVNQNSNIFCFFI